MILMLAVVRMHAACRRNNQASKNFLSQKRRLREDIDHGAEIAVNVVSEGAAIILSMWLLRLVQLVLLGGGWT